jgi:hypothetical protein
MITKRIDPAELTVPVHTKHKSVAGQEKDTIIDTFALDAYEVEYEVPPSKSFEPVEAGVDKPAYLHLKDKEVNIHLLEGLEPDGRNVVVGRMKLLVRRVHNPGVTPKLYFAIDIEPSDAEPEHSLCLARAPISDTNRKDVICWKPHLNPKRFPHILLSPIRTQNVVD